MARILIAEDEPDIRELVAFTLRFAGHEVTPTANGEEALQQASVVIPDLILMDVVMPGQNGFQLTRAISRDPLYADVPIIMCTSKNQETDRVWGMRQGARDYITKPVDATELMAKIKALS